MDDHCEHFVRFPGIAPDAAQGFEGGFADLPVADPCFDLFRAVYRRGHEHALLACSDGLPEQDLQYPYRMRHSGGRYYPGSEGQCGDDVRRIFRARDLAAVQERFRVCQVGFRHYFGGNSLSAGADLPFRHSRRAGGDDPGSTHGRAYRSFPDALLPFSGQGNKRWEVRRAAALENGQKYRHHHCPRVWKRWASVGGNVGAKAGNQTL